MIVLFSELSETSIHINQNKHTHTKSREVTTSYTSKRLKTGKNGKRKCF